MQTQQYRMDVCAYASDGCSVVACSQAQLMLLFAKLAEQLEQLFC